MLYVLALWSEARMGTNLDGWKTPQNGLRECVRDPSDFR